MEQIRTSVNVVYISSITASILFFCLGTTITWISPVASRLENVSNITFKGHIPTDFISAISNLPTVGASISSYFYTHIADKFGRKISILSIGMPYLLPYLMMAIRDTPKTYLVARFMLGLAMGGTFSVIPIYSGELSNKNNRATLNSIGGVMLAAGALFSFVLGNYVSLKNYNLILAIFPALFYPLFFCFGQETAHYYLFKKQPILAREAIMKLRGLVDNDIDHELENIENIIKNQSDIGMVDFIQKKMFVKNFTVVIGLLIFQQIAGMNAILMFNETIFELTETEFDSAVCCVIVGIVQFCSSLFVLTYEERFGRKTLLITSALSMSILLTILGIHCILIEYGLTNSYLKLLPLIVLSLFVICYFAGVGSIPFVFLSEIIPWRVKSISVSIISTIYWITVFLIVRYFPIFAQHVGLGSSFLGLAGLCIVSIGFVHFYVEETKGKTFEEIQIMFGF